MNTRSSLRTLTTVAVAALALAGCGSAHDEAGDKAGDAADTTALPQTTRTPTPTPTIRSDRRTVIYRLDGNAGSADLMYSAESGVKKANGVPFPGR